MKKFLAILVFLGLAVCKAGAYEWTDANGVTWDYDTWYDYTGGPSYRVITGAKGYSGIVNVPSTVSDGYSTYTVEGFSGYSFNGCHVKLPSTIKYISGLMTSGIISIDAATPPRFEKGPTIEGSQSGVTILVPEANLSTYRNADGWKELEVNIISQSAKTDYDINVTAISNSSGIHAAIGEDNLVNVMTMKVTGTINSYDIMIMRNKMHNLHYLDLTNANIVANTYYYFETYSTTDNVLGDRAFMDMNKLITVKLPKTIIAIGYQAFSGCNGLQNVEFQEGLRTIGDQAFSGCGNLQSALLKNGLESIGYNAFSSCGKLKTVQLKNGLTRIGYSAFQDCYSLTAIEIPEGVTRIESYTFNNCNGLKSVSLPLTLIDIDFSSFRNCSSLTNIILPKNLDTIESDAFRYCSSLAEVHIPSTVRTIGENAFSDCPNLRDYYAYTMEPTKIIESTFSNWTTSTLHVPDLAYYNYYWDTQWSKFDRVVMDNDYKYDYFYLTRDYVFTDAVGTMNSTPDVQLDGGSGLVVETTNTINLNEVHMGDNAGGTASIIANGNLKAEKVFIDLFVDANRWYFISLPFRVKVANITAPGLYAIRYYDGATRASNGNGGWKNHSGEYLLPKQGYILQCNTSGQFTLAVEKEDLDFTGGDRQDVLTSYASTNAQNASWNFLGNPHSSYFDIDDTGYEAPITVWNGTSYQAVRAGDDQYHLGPLQGFFVQKPDGQAEMNFPATGRHTLNQWADRIAAKKATSRSRAESQSQRQLVNLTIGDGEKVDDQTRVVFNPVKSQGYEMDCDAAKFMSDQPVAQLYSLDEQTRYAINERPQGEVNLGYVAPEKGLLTINAVRMDSPVLLRDNEMGITHDLTMGGYTFNTEAGTFESRFVLTFDLTAINKVENNSMAEKGTVYTLGGTQLPDGSQRSGAYILKNGNKVTKVLKK